MPDVVYIDFGGDQFHFRDLKTARDRLMQLVIEYLDFLNNKLKGWEWGISIPELVLHFRDGRSFEMRIDWADAGTGLSRRPLNFSERMYIETFLERLLPSDDPRAWYPEQTSRMGDSEPTSRDLLDEYQPRMLFILAELAKKLKTEGYELKEPRFVATRPVSPIVREGRRKWVAVLVFEIDGTPGTPYFNFDLYPPGKGNKWFRWGYGPFRSPEVALTRMEEDLDLISRQIPLVIEGKMGPKDWTPKKS